MNDTEAHSEPRIGTRASSTCLGTIGVLWNIAILRIQDLVRGTVMLAAFESSTEMCIRYKYAFYFHLFS